MSPPFTLYLDESGTRDWPSNGSTRGRRCIVAGILLTDAQEDDASDFVSRMLADLSEDCGREIEELHFHRMMGQHREFKGLTPNRSRHYLNEFLQHLMTLRAPLLGRIVDLPTLWETHANTFTPFQYGLRSALFRANYFAKRHQVGFRVSIDGGQSRNDGQTRKFILGLGSAQAGLDTSPIARALSLDRLRKDAIFTPASQSSPGVQHADGVAWLLQSCMTRGDQRILHTRGLWVDGPPTVVPGAKRAWSVVDPDFAKNAFESEVRRREQPREVSTLRQNAKPPADAPTPQAPSEPPAGARIKRDRFPWI